MGIEIERKFLVDTDAWKSVEKGEGTPIKQGYLFKSVDKTIRIRQKGEKGFITVKGKSVNHISRAEFEYQIPLKDAQQMLMQLCPAYIEKIRYQIDVDGFTWEVDEFIQPRQGLILAEIELPSEDTVFKVPSWIKEEVSHDPQYYNANMLND